VSEPSIIVDDPPLTVEEQEEANRWLDAHPEYVAEVRRRITESFSRSSPLLDAFKKAKEVRGG